jgi:excisionase family DNA binding protein
MKLLTSKDVQELLGISRPTLYSWVRMGKLHAVRAGRNLLFHEDEIRRLLGFSPSVGFWIVSGPLDGAKELARGWLRRGVRPFGRLEYLSDPGRDEINGRVASAGEEAIQHPAPGGATFDSLVRAKTDADYVFLGSEESAWLISDVRPERSPSGEPYIALYLRRVARESGQAQMDRRKEEAVAFIREGFDVRIPPFTREELHERNPH